MFTTLVWALRPRQAERVALWASVGLLACSGVQRERYPQTPAALAASAGGELQVASEVSPERSFQAAPSLRRAPFVRAALRQNPSLEAARQAVRAAAAVPAQRKALADPLLEYSFAPLSIGSSDVPYGQTITLKQALPGPKKRALSAGVALADAEAAQHDLAAAQLRVALAASLLFDRYYAVARSLELNAEHSALVQEIKLAAQAQYEAGRASQHDPLQAEIELAHIDHERIRLMARRGVLTAQMNGLLHRPPDAALPPPPSTLELPDVPDTSSAQLSAEALAAHPGLRAQQARIRGRRVQQTLADRAFVPDFSVMTSYSSMWPMREHQWMAGFALNVPLQAASRRASTDAAEAQLAQASAQLRSERDAVRVEVEEARQRLIEAAHVVRLYQERLLPLTRAQIDAAQSGYVTGRGGFQALLQAERSLRDTELRFQEALSTLGERHAELAQARGQIPGLAARGETP